MPDTVAAMPAPPDPAYAEDEESLAVSFGTPSTAAVSVTGDEPLTPNVKACHAPRFAMPLATLDSTVNRKRRWASGRSLRCSSRFAAGFHGRGADRTQDPPRRRRPRGRGRRRLLAEPLAPTVVMRAAKCKCGNRGNLRSARPL